MDLKLSENLTKMKLAVAILHFESAKSAGQRLPRQARPRIALKWATERRWFGSWGFRPRLSPFSLKDCCWVEKAWDQQLCGLEGWGASIACHAVTVRKVWLAEASVLSCARGIRGQASLHADWFACKWALSGFAPIGEVMGDGMEAADD